MQSDTLMHILNRRDNRNEPFNMMFSTIVCLGSSFRRQCHDRLGDPRCSKSEDFYVIVLQLANYLDERNVSPVWRSDCDGDGMDARQRYHYGRQPMQSHNAPQRLAVS
jgi:hypothetical protein